MFCSSVLKPNLNENRMEKFRLKYMHDISICIEEELNLHGEQKSNSLIGGSSFLSIFTISDGYR